jgi:protein TonB
MNIKAGSVVITLGAAVSMLLHVAAVIWWLRQPVLQPVAMEVPAVTVDLIAPTPSLIPAAPLSPPPAPAAESEILKDDAMAVQHKTVKKPKSTPKPKQQEVQKPIQQSKPSLPTETPVTVPVKVAAATAASSLAQVTAARFDANYLSRPATYPPLSVRMNEEGLVVLQVDVSADGRPLDVVLKQSSGFTRLDQAAIKTVAQWQFKPAQQNGRAVASTVDVPLLFTLKKK